MPPFISSHFSLLFSDGLAFIFITMLCGCNFQVIVKFIRKAKILVDCWVEDAILGSIPLEIALLAKFKHPNIVKVKHTYVLVPSSWNSAH